MSVNDDENNNKINNTKIKTPIYFSPYAHKKKVIGNLYTEPKKIPIQTDQGLKNKIKQKISNPIITKNIININPQECFKKGSKFLLSQMNDKSYQQKKSKPQSYKKVNSKLYLKKNAIPYLSSFNDNNSNVGTTQLQTNSNLNTQSNNSRNTKLYKNKPANMKYNMGKNYVNNYTSVKDSNHNLKKSAGSATELFGNNMIKKTKTKNSEDLNNININQIGYILTSPDNNNKQFLSPQNIPAQKIIFIKNNNKLKDKNNGHNISKESLKVFPNQPNDQINNNIDNKNKDEIQYLLRNTYNNVKIYPTTFLNNKIIYQTENNSNSNINTFINNTSRPYIKNNIEKKEIFNKNNNYENADSIEEVHFLYVNTIQKGNNLILKFDRCNN